MFLLVCGEDTVKSRGYISALKKSYRDKNHRVMEITPSELDDQLKNEADISLFGEPTIYITQGLLGHWSKKKIKSADQIKELIDDQVIKVIDWEQGKSLYDLRLKPAPHIKEFKVDTSIFDLQDMIMPGQKTNFIDRLNRLKEIQDPFLLYTMVHRHTRLLLLLNTNQPTGNVNPYVKTKAAGQARKWETQKLKQFYFGLTKIDQAVKTSSTPYNIPQSLEILACYFM